MGDWCWISMQLPQRRVRTLWVRRYSMFKWLNLSQFFGTYTILYNKKDTYDWIERFELGISKPSSSRNGKQKQWCFNRWWDKRRENNNRYYVISIRNSIALNCGLRKFFHVRIFSTILLQFFYGRKIICFLFAVSRQY